MFGKGRREGEGASVAFGESEGAASRNGTKAWAKCDGWRAKRPNCLRAKRRGFLVACRSKRASIIAPFAGVTSLPCAAWAALGSADARPIEWCSRRSRVGWWRLCFAPNIDTHHIFHLGCRTGQSGLVSRHASSKPCTFGGFPLSRATCPVNDQ